MSVQKLLLTAVLLLSCLHQHRAEGVCVKSHVFTAIYHTYKQLLLQLYSNMIPGRSTVHTQQYHCTVLHHIVFTLPLYVCETCSTHPKVRRQNQTAPQSRRPTSCCEKCIFAPTIHRWKEGAWGQLKRTKSKRLLERHRGRDESWFPELMQQERWGDC